MRKMY